MPWYTLWSAFSSHIQKDSVKNEQSVVWDSTHYTAISQYSLSTFHCCLMWYNGMFLISYMHKMLRWAWACCAWNIWTVVDVCRRWVDCSTRNLKLNERLIACVMLKRKKNKCCRITITNILWDGKAGSCSILPCVVWKILYGLLCSVAVISFLHSKHCLYLSFYSLPCLLLVVTKISPCSS